MRDAGLTSLSVEILIWMRACNMDLPYIKYMLCHILSTAQKDWVWVQEYRFVILSTQLLSGRFTEADSDQCRKVRSAKLVHF